jgi:hypothetical protein
MLPSWSIFAASELHGEVGLSFGSDSGGDGFDDVGVFEGVHDGGVALEA